MAFAWSVYSSLSVSQFRHLQSNLTYIPTILPLCTGLQTSLFLSLSTTVTMDSFENFQYDSASSYGGMGVVDDNSSIYTANTNAQSSVPVDLESLSIVDDRSSVSSLHDHGHPGHSHGGGKTGIDEDFDAVLDDLKDEGQVDLPPHACR